MTDNGISAADVGIIAAVLGGSALLVLASPVAAGAGVAACFLLAVKSPEV